MEPQLCPLFQRAMDTPDHLALITETQVWSYAELNAMANHFCYHLRRKALKKVAA